VYEVAGHDEILAVFMASFPVHAVMPDPEKEDGAVKAGTERGDDMRKTEEV